MDFLVPGSEHPYVAVVLEGPSQLTSLPPHTLLGGTALRHCLLRQRGLTVLSVPYHEWWTLGGEETKREYLMEGLAKAGVNLPLVDPVDPMASYKPIE